MKLFWSKRFIRDFKRLTRQNPQIYNYVQRTLKILAENYAEPIKVYFKGSGLPSPEKG